MWDTITLCCTKINVLQIIIFFICTFLVNGLDLRLLYTIASPNTHVTNNLYNLIKLKTNNHQ